MKPSHDTIPEGASKEQYSGSLTILSDVCRTFVAESLQLRTEIEDNEDAHQTLCDRFDAARGGQCTRQDGSQPPRQHEEDNHGSGRLQDGSRPAIP